MKATRDGYGEALLELGERDKNVVVLTADVGDSLRLSEFAKRWPERFIECGVAEQNMMGVAAGLAAAGKIPFVSSYAVFSPGRSWDQMRVAGGYSNLHIIIAGGHTGLAVGEDGATHQALEDMAITRVIPNMTVLVPADFEETKKATLAAADISGPVYIRLTREKSTALTKIEDSFEIGKINTLFNSKQKEVAIVGCGPILGECLMAAEELKKEGIGTEVINCHTIKPLDKTGLLRAAEDCGAMVTAEDHQMAGGMGSAIAEFLITKFPLPMEMVGVRDSFGESGKPEELAEKYGLKAKNIIEAAKKAIARKKNVFGLNEKNLRV